MKMTREENGKRPAPEAMLEVKNVSKFFPIRRGALRRVAGQLRAVDDVSLDVAAGTTLGLVGESGSGKTSLGRVIVRLTDASSGVVRVDGTEITGLSEKKLRGARRKVQIVFQDPYSSFDPQATVGDSLGEPLRTHQNLRGARAEARAKELLEMVHLSPTYLRRYPQELSGGQLQRIAVARALAPEPALLVLDEPVSSLDVSTQAQIVNLLSDLQKQMGLTCLFIAHDISVVRHISEKMAVMHLGRVLEFGSAAQICEQPRHPYTMLLLSSVPKLDRRRVGIRSVASEPPSPVNVPSGCRFHTRCPFVMPICVEDEPPRIEYEDGSWVACHLHARDARPEGLSGSQLSPD